MYSEIKDQEALYFIIKKLKNISSINEKIEILNKNKENELLHLVLKATYDKSFVYNIKQLPETDKHIGDLSLKDAILQIISVVVENELRGKKAQEFLKDIFTKVGKEDYEVLKLIIQKDLKCGINTKLINKVFPDLLYEHKYMGAVPYDEKKVKKLFETTDVIGQEKLDGEYMALFIYPNLVKGESRNTKSLYIAKAFLDDVVGKFHNVILFGEVLVEGYDRLRANGLVNSLNKLLEKESKDILTKKDIANFEKRYGLSKNEAFDKLRYVVWDLLMLDEYFCKIVVRPMWARIKELESKINNLTKISFVETRELDNVEDAKQFFREVIDRGGEGIIIKDKWFRYKAGKPTSIIKFKQVDTIDLRIVGVLKGNKNTKYENVINRLICKSDDGLIETQVGGLDENTMYYVTANDIGGKIVEIEHNGIIKSKEKNIYSLLHPRFIRFRDDKDETDVLKTLKEQYGFIEN